MRHPSFALILAVLLLLCATVLADGRGPTEQTTCIGILGAVERPGVYAFPSPGDAGQRAAGGVRLGDLLEAAGGHLETVSGNVRIFRGRFARSGTNLVSGRGVELEDGDLIVVDGGDVSFAASSDAGSSVSANVASRVDEQRPITVGVLGVYSTPAVVRLAADPGTLADLLAELPIAASEGWVTLHRPHAPPRRLPIDEGLTEQLADAGVVVFDLRPEAGRLRQGSGNARSPSQAFSSRASGPAPGLIPVAYEREPVGPTLPSDTENTIDAVPAHPGLPNIPTLPPGGGEQGEGVNSLASTAAYPALRPVPTEDTEEALSDRTAEAADTRRGGATSSTLRWAPWVCLIVFVACLMFSRGWFRRSSAKADHLARETAESEEPLNVDSSDVPQQQPRSAGEAGASLRRTATPPLGSEGSPGRPLRSPLTGRVLGYAPVGPASQGDADDALRDGGGEASAGPSVRISALDSHRSPRPRTIAAALLRVAGASGHVVGKGGIAPASRLNARRSEAPAGRGRDAAKGK